MKGVKKYKGVCIKSNKWVYGSSYYNTGNCVILEQNDLKKVNSVKVFKNSISTYTGIDVNYRDLTPIYFGDIIIYNNRDKYLVTILMVNNVLTECLINIKEKEKHFTKFTRCKTHKKYGYSTVFGVWKQLIDIKNIDWLEDNKKHIKFYANKFTNKKLVKYLPIKCY